MTCEIRKSLLKIEQIIRQLHVFRAECRAKCILGFAVTDVRCIPSALTNCGFVYGKLLFGHYGFEAIEDKQMGAARSIELIGILRIQVEVNIFPC